MSIEKAHALLKNLWDDFDKYDIDVYCPMVSGMTFLRISSFSI